MMRGQALDRLGSMLKELKQLATDRKLKLAPFVGVACPSLIDERGTIVRGGHEPAVLLHDDAVLQGPSAVPDMADVEHWGVLTIGIGLGNARFTNRAKVKKKEKE
jgi:hypothetical protein